MPKPIELNEAQQAALDLDRNVAVLAVAGSGKTTVLVNRYIKILENDDSIDPSGILAITFNESAAAHLRTKIRENLYERADAPRWRDACRALNEAPISTIHGFCARVLREHPIEAGVDPDFSVLDPIDSALLLTDAVQETFDRARPGNDTHTAILTLTSNLVRRPDQHLEKLIAGRDTLADILADYSNMSIDEIIETSHKSHHKAVTDTINQMKKNGSIHNLRQLTDLANDATGSARDTLDRIDSIRDNLDTHLHDLAATFLTKDKKSARKKAPGKKSDWTNTNSYERYRELFQETALAVFSSGLGEIVQFLPAREHVWAETVHALLHVYRSSLKTYTEMKHARRTLDFCDLQQRCADLLETRPDIRDLLAARYSHIMVDEFQDTNSLQWRVIHRLAQDKDGNLRQKGLFIVGDEAQSIYGFRNAEIEVFRKVRKQIRNLHATKDIESTENFRSTPKVITAVNTMFGQTHQYLDLVPFRKSVHGATEIIRADLETDKPSMADQCVEEARLIAARILAATQPGPMQILVENENKNVEPARFGDMTVLLRARTYMPAVFNAFKSGGINYHTASGVGYFRQQEVWDILNTLRCIAVPGNDVALAGYLRSTLAAISDETLLQISIEQRRSFPKKLDAYIDRTSDPLVTNAINRLDRWRDAAGKITIQDLVRNICDDTGVWMILESGARGSQPAENIERLIDMARAFSSGESRDIRAFLERMDFLVEADWRQAEAPVDAAATNAVRIMTVHESKGLEFPIVFVMQCHRKYNFGDRDVIKIHKKEGFGFKVPDPENAFKREPTSQYAAVRNITKKEARNEEMRLLHVACTRAKDALFLSGCGDPKPDTWWDHILQNLPPDNDAAIHRKPNDLENIKNTAIQTDPNTTVLDEIINIADGPTPKDDDIPADVHRTIDGLENVKTTRQHITITPGEWATYCRCPRHYFYLSLIRADEPAGRVDDSEPMETTPQNDETFADPRDFGTLVHNALELFIRGAAIENAVKQSINETDISEPHLDETVKKIINEFASSDTGQAARSAIQTRAEQTFTLKTKRAIVHGTIDLLWQDDEQWHIVDYKTSRFDTDKGTGRTKSLADRYRPQLELYALATRRFTQSDTPVQSTLYFTDAPEDPYHYPPFTENKEQELTDRLDKAATLIAANPQNISAYETAPNIHNQQKSNAICQECGFQNTNICKAHH